MPAPSNDAFARRLFAPSFQDRVEIASKPIFPAILAVDREDIIDYQLGCPTGFEPATSWATTRCSNRAELRAPYVRAIIGAPETRSIENAGKGRSGRKNDDDPRKGMPPEERRRRLIAAAVPRMGVVVPHPVPKEVAATIVVYVIHNHGTHAIGGVGVDPPVPMPIVMATSIFVSVTAYYDPAIAGNEGQAQYQS